MAEESLTWFAGVDWGSERHQACLLDAQGNTVAELPAGRGHWPVEIDWK